MFTMLRWCAERMLQSGFFEVKCHMTILRVCSISLALLVLFTQYFTLKVIVKSIKVNGISLEGSFDITRKSSQASLDQGQWCMPTIYVNIRMKGQRYWLYLILRWCAEHMLQSAFSDGQVTSIGQLSYDYIPYLDHGMTMGYWYFAKRNGTERNGTRGTMWGK